MPPARAPKQIVVKKIDAALAQLESAIWLWFTKDDPISIRALSEAAHDCYHGLCKHQKRPSILRDFLQTQPKAFQRREAKVRSFFKHGFKDLTGKVQLNPIYAEVQLFECVCCHIDLTGTVTPLLRLYSVRFALECASDFSPEIQNYWFAGVERDKFGEIELAKQDRTEFFQQLLPIAQQLPAKPF